MSNGLILPPALAAWFHNQIPNRDIVRLDKLAGGYRNDNIVITTDRGDRYVVRRYCEPGACAVELAVTKCVRELVAVPEVLGADVDGTATGAPVLLVAFVKGEQLSGLLPSLDVTEARKVGSAIGAALAQIGTVRFGQAGFFTNGKLDPVGVDGEAADLVEYVKRRLDRIDVLKVDEKKQLIRLADRSQPLIEAASSTDQLVHADFNAKNLIVACRAGQWNVSVLDWEFAYSGNPLADVANMLRYPEDLPLGFEEGFIAGFRGSGGVLGERWRETSRALDLFAFADLLTLPESHPLASKVREAIRHRIRRPA